ncbi:Imm43 family immunity protein [Lysinibacillus sp. NPDC056185]|uniref:Imm43 family immunity protein n=1 Tax=Lysinibacillus sp. NPDC056185 TaxID=3345739 RepID=UPI0039EF26D9
MGETFAIFEKEGIFCPTYLEGIIHTEFFENDPFEARDSDAGEWRNSRDNMTEMPEEVWFVTKDIKYNFDLRLARGGFFVSLEFLNLLQKFGINNFQYTKAYMVNKHKESISSKEYFFVRFYNKLKDEIDMEKSNIEFYKQDGRIKKIWDLQLKKSDNLPDVFLLNNTRLLSILFCSEEFKKEAEKLKLKGITFVPSNEAGVYKP